MKINKITMLTTLAILASSEAYSHGYVGSPASRALLCKDGKNKNCGSRAQYEPQSIEQVDGFFDLGELDGNMGGAEVTGFGPLDEQEQSRWAKTVVRSGEPLKIKWQFTANHKSKHFKFYITKPDWNPNEPLVRSDFEAKPLNCYNPQPTWIAPNQPPKDGLTFTCTMPNRSGYQIIMAEWDVEDTRMSFYNLLDLDFRNDQPVGSIIAPDGSSSGGSAEGTQAYDPSKSYSTPGTEVLYNGKIYQNRWYANPNEKPLQNSVWQFVRDHSQQSDPTDKFPNEVTKFTINPTDIKADDKIYLQVSNGGEMTDYLLMSVPKDMSSNDLLIELAKKINSLSTQKLDNKIIAGLKDNNNAVVPNGNSLYVYQDADNKYSEISFYFQQAHHNIKNMLHLMDFKSEYTLDQNGELHINGKIMSHSTAKANVSVTLQDANGQQVFREDNIELPVGSTHDLALKISNVKEGQYKLIISSIIEGAKTWQKDMNIQIKANEDTPPADKEVDVMIESNTPFYQIKADDSVIPRTWTSSLGKVNLANYQITIAPWSKTLQASGNDSSAYVKCPLPTNNQSNVTYLVSGDLNNITCKIK